MDTPSASTQRKMAARPKAQQRRSLGRWIRRGFAAIFVVGIAALIVVAMLPKPVPVDLARASTGPLVVTVDDDGVARVKDRYVVSAPLSGSMARIELDPGDHVKQGDVLARIVPVTPALLDERSKTSAEARVSAALAAQQQAVSALERARAHYEFTKKDAERQSALFARGAVSSELHDQAVLAERTASADARSARFGVQVADYEVKMARAALGRLSKRDAGKQDQMTVPSPVSGRVLKVLHQSEGVVSAGTPLVEVGDPRALEIVVDVLTSDAVGIRPGARARIVEWGGAPLQARVRRLEPSAFTEVSALGVEEQRVNVVLDLDSPPAAWAALGDGYRVKAEIVVHDKPKALTVPASAVFRHDAGWAVFRAENGVARLSAVEIGLRTPHRAEVARGLSAGTRVVLHPSDRVHDGVRISPR